MSILKDNFFKTLWEEKKLMVIAGGVVVVFILMPVTCYKVKRSWNWNMGGYASRTQEMINDNNCRLGEAGAFRKEFPWKDYCD